ENPLGPWNGGSIAWVLQVFSSGRAGIPPESVIPYNGDADWADLAQGGDVPMLTGGAAQHPIDDFNLNAELTPYKIPASYSERVLPRLGLNEARSRPTNVIYATADQYKDVNWYRGQLAAGYPVAFGVHLTSDSKDVNGVWHPGATVYAGHAMLIVGYSDAEQA